MLVATRDTVIDWQIDTPLLNNYLIDNIFNKYKTYNFAWPIPSKRWNVSHARAGSESNSNNSQISIKERDCS